MNDLSHVSTQDYIRAHGQDWGTQPPRPLELPRDSGLVDKTQKMPSLRPKVVAFARAKKSQLISNLVLVLVAASVVFCLAGPWAAATAVATGAAGSCFLNVLTFEM